MYVSKGQLILSYFNLRNIVIMKQAYISEMYLSKQANTVL